MYICSGNAVSFKCVYFAVGKQGLGFWQSQKSSWMDNARPVHQGNLTILCMSHWVWPGVIRHPFKSLGFSSFSVQSLNSSLHSCFSFYWLVFIFLQFTCLTSFQHRHIWCIGLATKQSKEISRWKLIPAISSDVEARGRRQLLLLPPADAQKIRKAVRENQLTFQNAFHIQALQMSLSQLEADCGHRFDDQHCRVSLEGQQVPWQRIPDPPDYVIDKAGGNFTAVSESLRKTSCCVSLAMQFRRQ